MNGAEDIALRRLRWRARRGMLELDLYLQPFLERVGATLGADDRATFEAMLETDDVVLLEWCAGRSQPEEPGFARLIGMLRRVVAP